MLKKHILCALLTLLLATLFYAGLAETDEAPSEWTVLVYLCGSDLESSYGFASGNLREIANCIYKPRMIDISETFGGDLEKQLEAYRFVENGYAFEDIDGWNDVNVLIQTGGCRKWHAEEYDLEMEIDPAKLQRWRVEQGFDVDFFSVNHLVLEESLPLQSMASPQTLTDFILWGKDRCPAKKYALVLWGHGGVAKTGLFGDELFDGDMMKLDELDAALSAADTRFETMLFDACLMANIETAWTVRDHANWMVGSEEEVAGMGTSFGEWLRQLYNDPTCDGKQLGRWICDYTLIKYANENNPQAQSLATWSLIDLDRIERLGNLLDRYFEAFSRAYTRYPEMMCVYDLAIFDALHFDSGRSNMVDIGDVIEDEMLYTYMDADLRRELIDALTDAVVYNVRGSGRSRAHGLSFCYATAFDVSALDAYARNCPFPHYLAVIDAVHTWKAPDWVYERAERLPDIDTLPQYDVFAEKVMCADGTPGIILDQGGLVFGTVRYKLYRQNPKTDQIQHLGTFTAERDEYSTDDTGNVRNVWHADKPGLWPSIDGVYCSMITVLDGMDNVRLCNIPIQMDSERWYLRCGFVGQEYTVYGLWEGYDADSGLFNRNVRPLSQAAGQDYRLLYPLDSDGDPREYENSKTMTMPRSLIVEDMPLPAGKYFMEYMVVDIFEREHMLERVEMNWDGQTMTMAPNQDWSQKSKLLWNEK